VSDITRFTCNKNMHLHVGRGWHINAWVS
jgi:hypothetical protein